MNDIDKKIINIIQQNFPITSSPFKYIGDMIGVSEEEVLERITFLMNDGIIRRIGGVFETQQIGFCSTLIAINVPEERLEAVAEVINSFEGVSHNYQRNGASYNLWFTVMAKTEIEIDEILHQIKEKTEIEDIMNLPTIEKIKMFVNFEV